MSLKKQISEDLKSAMKAGETKKRDTLRLVDSFIRNVEIEKQKREEGLNDEEVIEVLSRAVKQRKDSISQFEQGGRADLAENEKEELAIIEKYLPEQLGGDVIREKVKEVIEKTGASSPADMGKVMGAVMGQLKGQADGNVVRQIVSEELK